MASLAFSSSAISNTEKLALENELLLDLRLDGERLGLDILGYQRGDDFLLSLDELSAGLGFSIEVDASKGVASGWYISEDRTFSLDMNRAEIVSNDTQWSIADGDVEIFEGGVYVETSVLETWFPIRLSAVVRKLYLDVVPTELLPVQERLNRRKRVVSRSPNADDVRYPLQPNPYRFFGPHISNVRLGYSTSRQNFSNGADYSGNYAWLSRGDFGWMTSTFSVTGQSEEEVVAARFNLERTGFDGPLGINHVEVGDVGASAFRGISLQGSNVSRAENERFNNESVTIEGSQLPDWDVEIYQNDQLIAIQTIGQDGRYLLEDIPLLFGENRFELQFFGPNGEIETREEFHFLGQSTLDTGQISYAASAVQQGLTMLGVNDVDNEGQGSGVYSGDVNVGLSQNLTLRAGLASQAAGGERLVSSSVGLSFSTSRLFGTLSYSDFSQRQDSVDTSLSTRLGRTNLNLQFVRYLDDPLLVTSVLKWQSSIDIVSSFYNVPLKLELSAFDQENNSQYEAVLSTTLPLSGSGRISTSIWHSSNETTLEDERSKTSQTGGQTSFNTNIRPWSFRLSTSYALQPELEISQISATSNLRIDNNMSLGLGIRRVASTDITHYSSGINWLLGEFAVGTKVSYDSTERWSGLITLGTTLVHQPGTLLPRIDRRATVSSGTVEARVFLDVTDSERQAVEGTDISALQSFRKATTNAAGVAYLSQMPANRQIDIELDESTLSDYEMRSSISGVSVVSRPGSYAIVEFPLVRTAELEGHINVMANGEEFPVSRARVSLKSPDGEVVTQTRTAFDGFYLFEGVEPGEYRISLDSPMERRVIERPADIVVTGTSGIINELDYTLSPPQPEIAVPAMFAQEAESQKDPDYSSDPLALPTLAASLPGVESEVLSQEPAEPQIADTEIQQPSDPQTDDGNWFVQIGAYDARDMAQASWERLSQVVQALQGKTARLMPYQSMTRLLVGPGTARDAASTLCKQLKAENLDCMLRRVGE